MVDVKKLAEFRKNIKIDLTSFQGTGIEIKHIGVKSDKPGRLTINCELLTSKDTDMDKYRFYCKIYNDALGLLDTDSGYLTIKNIIQFSYYFDDCEKLADYGLIICNRK